MKKNQFRKQVFLFQSIQNAKNKLCSIQARLRTHYWLGLNGLVIFLLCSPFLLLATQNKAGLVLPLKKVIVKGSVLDKATNAPIPYARISLVDKKTYVQANENGIFVLSLPPEQTTGRIKVSSLGYTSQEFDITDLVKQTAGSKELKLFLAPNYKSLKLVEVKAKAKKWKIRKVGYHLDEASSIHHEFYPSDTLTTSVSGQEIGNRFQLDKYPAFLRSISFGLAGSGGIPLKIRVRLYSLQHNMPYLNLLPESAVIAIPPHHTGWVTVNLQQYNLLLKEDFAIVLEWQTETNKLNTSSLMAFATLPKDQITYYRESNLKPWQIVTSTLLDVKSIGLYTTLLFKK